MKKRSRLVSWLLRTIILTASLAWIGFALWRSGAWIPVADKIGIIKIPVEISGTGSMYPTFPKGQGSTDQERAQETVATPSLRTFPGGIEWGQYRWGIYALQHGDIVLFENAATDAIAEKAFGEKAGFLKRVIAVPGDTLEIRDGFVLVNDQTVTEPYTALPRSTFGGTTVADCQKITIPDGHIFVLGDNRKASNDSRHELGLVPIADVKRVLPLPDQQPYQKLWRDTSKDDATAQKPTLDADKYLQLLNEQRKQKNIAPLKRKAALDSTAQKRAAVMLKFNDLSYEASKSGYTMEKAMIEVGYRNTVWSEAPVLGYYTAEELIDNTVQFPSWHDFLLNEEYQDAGIAAVVGEIHGCPAQIIVQHFAGYKPAVYEPQVVQSWQRALDQLREVRPNWQELTTQTGFYAQNKTAVDRMLEIMRIREAGMTDLLATFQKKEWLNEAQKAYLQQDQALGAEQTDLAEQINTAVQNYRP